MVPEPVPVPAQVPVTGRVTTVVASLWHRDSCNQRQVLLLARLLTSQNACDAVRRGFRMTLVWVLGLSGGTIVSYVGGTIDYGVGSVELV